MAVTRKSPKTIAKKSPSKTIPGTIRKITPLRKTKTPTSKTAFRSTRTTTSTPKKGSNIFSRSVIAKTSSTRTTAKSSKTPLTLGAKSTPGRTTPGRTTPGRTTPGRTTPGRTTPGRTTPGRTTPGRTTPGRTTPGRTTPGRTTPGRTTPGRARRASPKSLTALKPKSPTRKTTSSVAAKLTPNNQFIYISLSICSGLILFVLILFGFYKLYEYFNPSEKSTTDSIDFMEELDDLDAKEEETVEEKPEEEKITEEANEDN